MDILPCTKFKTQRKPTSTPKLVSSLYLIVHAIVANYLCFFFRLIKYLIIISKYLSFHLNFIIIRSWLRIITLFSYTVCFHRRCTKVQKICSKKFNYSTDIDLFKLSLSSKIQSVAIKSTELIISYPLRGSHYHTLDYVNPAMVMILSAPCSWFATLLTFLSFHMFIWKGLLGINNSTWLCDTVTFSCIKDTGVLLIFFSFLFLLILVLCIIFLFFTFIIWRLEKIRTIWQ